jgi:hypothetical protein
MWIKFTRIPPCVITDTLQYVSFCYQVLLLRLSQSVRYINRYYSRNGLPLCVCGNCMNNIYNNNNTSHTSNHWGHRNCEQKFTKISGNNTRTTLNRFFTKNCHTRNITHHKESATS